MKTILMIAFLTLVVLASFAAAQPNVVNQQVTQTMDGWAAASTQTATNSGCASSATATVVQTQVITQNAGMTTQGTAPVTQTAANQQPGVAVADAGGAVYTETINQAASTSAAGAGAITQNADNGPAGFEIQLNNAPGSVINEDITQTATGGAATGIVQTTGLAGAAGNTAMINGASAGARIDQDIGQTANGGAAVTQTARNGGLCPLTTIYFAAPMFGGAQIDGDNSVINQRINQNAPTASGAVVQWGSSMGMPRGNGDRVTQAVIQNGATTAGGPGRMLTQTGGNWQDANTAALFPYNNQVTTQSVTQTGTVPGAPAGTSAGQAGLNLASSAGMNNVITQTVNMDATGHGVLQGVPAPVGAGLSWNEVQVFFRLGTPSAFVTQRQDLIARLPTPVAGGSTAIQTSTNNAAVVAFWGAGVTGSLTQSINQTTAHSTVTQTATNT